MKTSLRQKFFLIVFGIFLCFGILELGLRLGGHLFFQNQSLRNFLASRHSSAYPILCVGESTTALDAAMDYPTQLQEILNHKQDQIRFAVFNKGIPAATTTTLLSELSENLVRFKPRIVIVMMGINDSQNTQVFRTTQYRAPNFFTDLRVFKLAHLLKDHLKVKWKETQLRRKTIAQIKKAEEKFRKDDSLENVMALVDLYDLAGESSKKNKVWLEVIEKRPRDPVAHFFVARHFFSMKDYDKVEYYCRKTLELLPASSIERLRVLNLLAQSYQAHQKFAEAKKIYHFLISLRPNDPQLFDTYTQLIRISLEEKDRPQAKDLLLRQLSLNPVEPGSYLEIAEYDRQQQNLRELEDLLNEIRNHIPEGTRHFLLVSLELANVYLDERRFPEAESIFRRVQAMPVPGPEDLHALAVSGLIMALESQGKVKEARSLESEIPDDSYYFPATVANYRALKKMILDRGIILIAVQYPMRPVQPLKRVLGLDENIFFVDNQKSFEEKVLSSSYSEYFQDRFAKNFGHCTPKGNRLLAENISEVILKEGLKNNLKAE